MKIIISLLLVVGFAFSFDNLHPTLQGCSEVKDDIERLNCYDSLALTKKPKTQLEIDGERLTTKCILCHGKAWDVSTNGQRFIKDMNESEIFDSLLAYKNKEIDSIVMNFHMARYSIDEIETMSKYLALLFQSKDLK